MTVLFAFAEGILAFISPCILPMVPIYLLYLVGGGEKKTSRLLLNTLGFILGFTLVFTALGASASALGQMLFAHKDLLQRVSGVVMILFGLHMCGLLKIGLLNKTVGLQANPERLNFLSSALFGAAFSFGWSPCLGPFLGSALLMASSSDTLWQGVGLLLAFSLGIGVPFLLTSVLMNQLQAAFAWIKRHYTAVQRVSGAFLIVTGLLLALDLIGYYMGLFS